MAVVREFNDEISIQTIGLSNTIYILENGSITLAAANEALAVDAGLLNITIQLTGGRIENLGAGNGADGILSQSSIRVELSDDSAIRTGSGSAIQTNTAGTGIDLVNHGSITNTSTTNSTVAGGTGTGRVVNFGVIKGATVSSGVVALGENSTIDNFGVIDAGAVGNTAIAFNIGTNIITNVGYIFGRLNFGTGINSGVDTLNNSGTIQGSVLLGGGDDVINNDGVIIGTINLGDGDDRYNGFVGGSYTGSVTGGNGEDTMIGTDWNDIFDGGNDNDFLGGFGGNDRIDGGDGDDFMMGGDGDDLIVGGEGADQLDGGAGINLMDGGAGIDTARYSSSFRGVGVSLLNYTLNTGDAAGDLFVSIENVLGSDYADKITGNGAANRLEGKVGNDTLDGGLGNDTLDGGLGNDILIGNAGKDTLTGDLGNDIFRYTLKTHSVVGANADRIMDFDDGGAGDKIDLSLLFGPALVYRHNGAFTAAGQVRINDVAGADVIVEVNTGGTLAADFAIRLVNTTLASMNAGDFVL